MSVIAKMNITKTSPFATGQHVELGCVCSNDLMAAYAESEEDKLFTKYSPWGEMHVFQPSGFALGTAGDHDTGTPADAFYVMVLFGGEAEDRPCEGAYAICQAVCYSRTEFGGDSVRVEFRDRAAKTDRTKGIDKLNWRMSVDNPGASNQFKAGEECLIAFFPASKFDRDTAIAAAHALEQTDEGA